MPVFTRLRDDVMTLTVDGDYTANELRRVAFNAFESDELPTRVPILLDMSGAAGVMLKSGDEMKAAGAIFGAFRDHITGLGVVVAADAHPLFADDSPFVQEAGLPVRPCHSHADARAWLGGENPA
ncbi:MAG: hypothetical protein L7S64_09080 [Longimicrobiales bacterium]|nr:hypothetical protein [Longimicrobiales bacterium]